MVAAYVENVARAIKAHDGDPLLPALTGGLAWQCFESSEKAAVGIKLTCLETR